MPNGIGLTVPATPMRSAWVSDTEVDLLPITGRAPRAVHCSNRAAAAQSASMPSSWSLQQSLLTSRRRTSGPPQCPQVDTAYLKSFIWTRKNVFLVSSRVAHEKPDIVIEAFKILDQQLVVSGTGPLEESLQASAGYRAQGRMARVARDAPHYARPS